MFFRHIRYRPSLTGLSGLPLPVRSTGHYSVSSSYSEKSSPKWFFQLYWGVRGSGSIRTNDREYEILPDCVFLYYPGEVHDLRANEDHWEYCWLTLDGSKVMQRLSAFDLSRLSKAGPCPLQYFEELDSSIRDNTVQGEVRASEIAYSILLRATHPCKAEEGMMDLAARARSQLDRHFRDPGMQVEELARILGIHRSTLFRRFSERYGLSPAQYLLNRRLQYGLSQLKSGPAVIQDICYASGFIDPNYFSRLVRERTGLSPTEFRKS